MKTYIFTTILVILCALFAVSCNTTVNIPFMPQGQPQGNPPPQGPGPGGDVPPGGQVPQNPPQGQPPQGQPQGNPPPQNPGPGGGKASTKMPIQNQATTLDLSLSNIFGNTTTGNIMATITNQGNTTVSTTVNLMCTANWRTCDVCQYASSTVAAVVNLTPGGFVNIDTGLDLNSAISHQAVTCSITPPSGDSNTGNNSRGPVTVK
jgi:hypothetical protein